MDLNHDRLVSLEEFLKSTEKKEFNNQKEWQVRLRHGLLLDLYCRYTLLVLRCFMSVFNEQRLLTSYLSTLNLSFKTLDDTKPVYTEEELQRFEAELRDKEVELGRRAEKLRQEQELLIERSKALEAQKREYQQVYSINIYYT